MPAWLAGVVLILVVVIAASAWERSLAPQVQTALAGSLEHEAPGGGVTDALWADVRSLYALESGGAVWMSRRRPSGSAAEALEVLARAEDHGLAPEDYGVADLDRMRTELKEADVVDEAALAGRLAEFDWRLTAAMLAFGRDLALGRQVRGAGTERRREPPDFAARLAGVLDAPEDWPDAIQPTHPAYAALQHALVELRAEREEGEWPEVPSTPLEPGDEGAGVMALRARMIASGDLDDEDTASPGQYDAAVEAAVKAFQARHGLADDGVAGPKTLDAMNVSRDDRIRQIGFNLDRWRWLPDDLGSTHILVNVPAAEMVVREGGEPLLAMRVIVGTSATRTPVFSGQMDSVVFSPYWHIPDSIAVGETAPKAGADPEYLRQQGIEILRQSADGVELVDPRDVAWDDPDELRDLRFRQAPGAANALGRVKFLFPNRHNVYLHDTPTDALFDRPDRAFSHGCVRVEAPEALARFVLRGHEDWTDERITAAMASGAPQAVEVDPALPVHLVYLTARVNDDGRVVFLRDVYGYDR
jgi:murein L,D-transpeptidase YcbB/YkuD